MENIANRTEIILGIVLVLLQIVREVLGLCRERNDDSEKQSRSRERGTCVQPRSPPRASCPPPSCLSLASGSDHLEIGRAQVHVLVCAHPSLPPHA